VQSFNLQGISPVITKDRRKKENGSDRRHWLRLDPEAIPFLKGIELNQGSENRIVNISKGGLLLETNACLGPDCHITLKLVTPQGKFDIEGKILRSSLYSLKGVPKYRTAIIFTSPLDLLDDLIAEMKEREQQNKSKSTTPEMHEDHDKDQLEQNRADNETEETPAILTIVASDANDIFLQESFELNAW
jgi:hypothetical protein